MNCESRSRSQFLITPRVSKCCVHRGKFKKTQLLCTTSILPEESDHSKINIKLIKRLALSRQFFFFVNRNTAFVTTLVVLSYSIYIQTITIHFSESISYYYNFHHMRNPMLLTPFDGERPSCLSIDSFVDPNTFCFIPK
jgi:type IV secretory pathway TrbL component